MLKVQAIQIIYKPCIAALYPSAKTVMLCYVKCQLNSTLDNSSYSFMHIGLNKTRVCLNKTNEYNLTSDMKLQFGVLADNN